MVSLSPVFLATHLNCDSYPNFVWSAEMKRSSVLARPKSDWESHPLAAPTTRCIPRNGTISGNSLAAAHACHSGAAIKVIWKLPAGSTGSVCAVRVLFQFILILFYFFLFCLPKRLNVRISPKAKYEREPFFFLSFLISARSMRMRQEVFVFGDRVSR